MQRIKILSLFLVFVVVSTFTLMILGKVSEIYFWIIIAVMAIFAYKILPSLKK